MAIMASGTGLFPLPPHPVELLSGGEIYEKTVRGARHLGVGTGRIGCGLQHAGAVQIRRTPAPG